MKTIAYHEDICASIVEQSMKEDDALLAHWNINDLQTPLQDIARVNGVGLGITTSMLLAGEKDTFSSFHIEDYALYSGKQ